MPTMNNPIWSSLWHRAKGEAIGIMFRVDKVWNGFYEAFLKSRPEELKDYVLSHTPNDTTFFITKPNAVIDDSIPD
jgi:hypothetical protein